MISARSVKRWYWIHKWSSLVSTLFLLMLCVTGLPLIFHDELEPLLSASRTPESVPPEQPAKSYEDIIARVRADHKDQAITYVGTEFGEDRILFVGLNTTPDAAPDSGIGITVDNKTGTTLGSEKNYEGVIGTLLWLHTGMFAGIPGKLFLGFMTLLFVLAIISGVVVYAPFMRRYSFATIRMRQGSHAKWIDYHKALGIVVTVWALVVGGTGAINTLADMVIKVWQYQELTGMIATSIKDDPNPNEIVKDNLSSVDQAILTAQEHEPGMELAFVAFPGTIFTSKKHYAVFLRGATAFTSKLIKPVLIDARSGEFTASREMPWYVSTLLLSQPLHFGDYGGLPLKIIWALLDIFVIIVLYSGTYLWWIRRKDIPILDSNDASSGVLA